jgi:hypothetical protein
VSNIGGGVGEDRTIEADVIEPFVRVLEGRPVPYGDLVRGGRMLAGALVARGKTLAVSTDEPWAGVWDLEHLTDSEAVEWGLCVATEACRA